MSEPTVEERRAQAAEEIARLRLKLAAWTHYIAARFGGPVYLTGSALHSPTPRDIDIRVVIPDEQFRLRYQQEPKEWIYGAPSQRWIDDMAALNHKAVRQARDNVDFQVWPKSHWRDDAMPTCPPIVLAAPSPRWFTPPEREGGE